MKDVNKRNLIRAIDKSTKDLHQQIDMHHHLMATLLKQRMDDGNINQLFLPAYSPDETKLKEAIRETIEILEESRKAFKSKRLEALRKKLTQVLIESKL